jgi:hypothetical protein
MFQIRIHGRGGQGVVTAAELLSVAAFAEGRPAQAFPSFGSERTGAPVVAFVRIDDRPARGDAAGRPASDRPRTGLLDRKRRCGQPGPAGSAVRNGLSLVDDRGRARGPTRHPPVPAPDDHAGPGGAERPDPGTATAGVSRSGPGPAGPRLEEVAHGRPAREGPHPVSATRSTATTARRVASVPPSARVGPSTWCPKRPEDGGPMRGDDERCRSVTVFSWRP